LEHLILSKEHLKQMENHIIQNLPEEACGMLGGKDSQVEVVIPITNQAHSPVKYFMEPVEMLKAFEWLEQHGLEMIATFHSHPMGPLHPSETDIREFYYPGTAMLIWAPKEGVQWVVRGFVIEGSGYREIPILFQNRNPEVESGL